MRFSLPLTRQREISLYAPGAASLDIREMVAPFHFRARILSAEAHWHVARALGVIDKLARSLDVQLLARPAMSPRAFALRFHRSTERISPGAVRT
jgi:hypothetical protein